MAEFFFNQANPDRRAIRNNSNVTGMSSNKNSEFKVPFPPRSTTQTLCSNLRPLQQNSEGSKIQCWKSIQEKLEVVDKLGVVSQDEVNNIASEFLQKLDSVCMKNITERLRLTNQNPAPFVVNENGSAFQSIISQTPLCQPSVRSCINCQGSNCGSEIGYSLQKGIPIKEPPLRPILERPERSKPKVTPALPVDDENDDSIVSFFKKNQSQNQNTKTGKKKFAPSVVMTNAVEKTTTNSGVDGRTSRINAIPRSQSVTRPRSNIVRTTARPRTKSVIRNSSEVITDDSELMNSALRNKVAVVINQVPDVKLTKNNAKSKRKVDTSVEPKKNKRVRKSKQEDDINITKNSLRSFPVEQQKSRKKTVKENSNSRRVTKKQTETKENEPVGSVFGEANEEERNICGYDQTDQEMFGDFSTIINDTLHMRDSPNVLKNVTKVSTNKNDQPSHIFSPFSNIRSTSGVSAISTPLSKTLPKTIINKRLKKPDVASEFKGAKPRPAFKRIVPNDVVNLDASQESEFCTSDFSDTEGNSNDS